LARVTRPRTRAVAWATVGLLAVLILLATFPQERYRSPYYMDDWDLVFDLTQLSWMDYLLRPSVSGHFRCPIASSPVPDSNLTPPRSAGTVPVS
jgi:hypothetical protein